jgi:hypothetical protein
VRRNVGLLGLLIALTWLLLVVVSDATGSQIDRRLTAAGDKRTAAALAGRELGAVTLPRGAVAVTPAPGPAKHSRLTPPGAPDLETLLDVHRDWSVRGQPASVIAFMTAHAPAGTKVTGTGYSSGPGDFSQSVSLALRHLPAGVYAEGLTIDAGSDGANKSLLWVDSWAAWLLPRPASEQIPAGIGAVTVLGDLGNRAYPVATITAPDQVAALVGLVNRQQREQPGVTSCPFWVSPLIDLRFRRAAATPVLARVAEDGCYGLHVALGGRVQPELDDGIDLTGWLWARHILSRCARAALTASARPPGPNGGRTDREVTVQFRNRSGAVCGVAGEFPTVTSRPPMRLHDLRPGSRAVVSLGPNQSAQFELSWTDPSPLCQGRSIAELRIWLPPSTVPFDVSVGSPREPFRPCGAAVDVGSLMYGL